MGPHSCRLKGSHVAAHHPVRPTEADFELVKSVIPEVGEGQLRVRNLGRLIQTRGTSTGFLVGDHNDLAQKYAERAAGWLDSGQLTSNETFRTGIDRAVDAFLRVLVGENTGKMVVQLDRDTVANSQRRLCWWSFLGAQSVISWR